MKFPFYSGNPEAPATDGPAQLPISRRAGQEDPRGYLPDPLLICQCSAGPGSAAASDW
jgi:hypothetical protein